MRKVARLTIALALVVVVMQQASRRELYEPFFSAKPAYALPQDRQRPKTQQPPVEQTLSAKDRETDPGLQPVSLDPAWQSVVDGATWRAGDYQMFYRLLDRASRSEPTHDVTPPPLVGALPMLQQPKIYQGRLVRVAGKLARIERRTAKPNEEVNQYWELWLRPSDNSNRPILAISPRVPDAWQALVGDEMITNGPAVAIRGWFLKRLAYRSQKGADLAPAVIGAVTNVPAATLNDAAASARPQPVEPQMVWWWIGAAVLIGVGLAGLAMWRSSVHSAELRRTRASASQRSSQWLREFEADERSR